MIELIQVGKKFHNITALNSISCTVKDGEFLSFLGPSGSGKSTLLNIIAGIIPLTTGKVLFDGMDGNMLKPQERNIGFVFQNYALYPNLTVYKNIMFPLESLKISHNERSELANNVANMVKIEHLMGKKPHELSGGEQQRVAIARALVKRPRLLLLDEPFSNIDPHLSKDMRGEIKKLQIDLKITTIMVTHNQSEAMELSDRIALLSEGNLMQLGNTHQVYNRPENLFSAQFLGDVRINTLCGTARNGLFYLNGNETNIYLNQKHSNGSMIMCIRPENVSLKALDKSGDIVLSARISSIFNHGRELVINTQLGNEEIRFFVPPTEHLYPGQDVELCFDKKHILFFDRKSGKRIDI